MANGGYFELKDGAQLQKDTIQQLNDHFDQAVDAILDPNKAEREQQELEDNPLFAAGMRGLERLKWDIEAEAVMAAQLREQGLVRD